MDIAENLFNLLVSKNFTIKTLDKKGKPIIEPNESKMFSFDYEVGKNNYGTVVILLGEDQKFEIYYGDNVGKRMEDDDKNTWYDFLQQLRFFAKRNLYDFSLKNINQLKYSMQGMAAIKEGLFEGWKGTSKTSYNNKNGKTRLLIRHSKQMHEGDQRWRAIDKLFVETADGERFKLPFKNLAAGRAMTRHIQEGGNPYDVFGEHIIETVKEINTLAKFVRATRKIAEDNEQYAIVEAGRNRYKTLRQRLKSVTGKRGYHSYVSSWTPEAIDDDDAMVNELKQQFINQELDERISEALPYLSRQVSEQDIKMKELNEFEEWADEVTEAPEFESDSDKVAELQDLMSTPIEVGIDATNASQLLYDLIGDDAFFDSLSDLAERDPQADVRPMVTDWLETNMPEIAGQITTAEPESQSPEWPEEVKGGHPDEDDWGDDEEEEYKDFDSGMSSGYPGDIGDYQAGDDEFDEPHFEEGTNEMKDIDSDETINEPEKDPMLEEIMRMSNIINHGNISEGRSIDSIVDGIAHLRELQMSGGLDPKTKAEVMRRLQELKAELADAKKAKAEQGYQWQYESAENDDQPVEEGYDPDSEQADYDRDEQLDREENGDEEEWPEPDESVEPEGINESTDLKRFKFLAGL